jgi:lipopolysaccharide biosynthesis glycosyltransferase
MCVFHNKNYISLLKLLLTSIHLKHNMGARDTHVLVITSSEFQPIIEKECLMLNFPIQYYILNLNTILESAVARLHIFEYNHIRRYSNILYLDTDILVNGDLDIIFELPIESDKLYAVEEGTIGDEYHMWGGSFFDFSIFCRDTPAFSTSVLYFKNSQSIKTLFENTRQHIRRDGRVFSTLEQPFLVYNAFIENKYDNQLLNTYIRNRPTDVEVDKIIYHFAEHPGNYGTKYEKMVAFRDKLGQTGLYGPFLIPPQTVSRFSNGRFRL